MTSLQGAAAGDQRSVAIAAEADKVEQAEDRPAVAAGRVRPALPT
jgi:hypothetical protein